MGPDLVDIQSVSRYDKGIRFSWVIEFIVNRHGLLIWRMKKGKNY